jgi:4-hydroxybenzoate polyprenyltransferase
MKRDGTVRAYLELFRLPNVFTAIADVALGFMLTHTALVGDDFSVLVTFVLLMTASCFLYTAGMVLNDAFDAEIDAAQRPHRPIPSGRVTPTTARWLGNQMLLIGVALGWTTGWLSGSWFCGVVVSLLAVCVYAYDAVLKSTPLGPLAMGGCRMLNVLLGASAAATAWHTLHWAVAGGLGVYIVGVTWFARTEARVSSRPHLVGATAVMIVGLAVIASYPALIGGDVMPEYQPKYFQPLRWFGMWAALAAVIIGRCGLAIVRPTPRFVQMAVKGCIQSLVIVDAAAVYALRGPWCAIGILLLLVPTMYLGRWIYST